MPLLAGKKALIFGIANHRSIGWAIAQALAAEGAQLAFSYQERMEKYVRELAAKIPGTVVMECDVQNDDQLDAAFATASEVFNGQIDILIHSVAFAPPRELENPFVETTREGFHTALEHQRLFTGGDGETCQTVDANEWRQYPHAHLHGKRARNAQIQCHGCGKGRA